MMNYLYRVSLVLIVFISSLGINYSAVPYNPMSEFTKSKSNQIAYSIVCESKVLSNGIFIPTKVYNIPRLSADNYVPNAVQIKTREYGAELKSAKGIYNPHLQDYIKSLNTSNLRAPFEYTFKGKNNIQALEQTGINRIYEIYYDSETNPYDVCIELMKNPEVEYAVPIFKRSTCAFTPNDPQMSSQWHISKLQLAQAWDLSKGDTNVVIGIVDSGVDWGHEDLAANIWTNPGEIGLDKDGKDKKTNGIDDDGNGKKDDYRGWDLIGNVNSNELYSGMTKEDNNPMTGANTHGTHVAGCASAVTNNGKGVAAPGFNCRILAVKCAPDINSTGIFRGYEGIVYAANTGAKVINCSWGGSGNSPAEQDVINYAISKGAVVVVASGNDANNIDEGGFFPAGYDGVICVGASASNDRVSGFSNTGYTVTVYSPGSSIFATLPSNRYAGQDGTSMASPVLAGIVGLIRSLHPTWDYKQISHQVRSTSDNVLNTDPTKRPFYYGRVNAYNALKYNNGFADKVPGIECSKTQFTTGNTLNDFTQREIKFTIKNYLGDANNLTVKLQALGNYLSISQTSISLGTLASMESKDITLNVQLLQNNPWYRGNAQILMTFTSGAYTDYQLIKLPVVMTSPNQYTRLQGFSEGTVPTWQAAHSSGENNIWAVGNYGIFGGSGGYFAILNNSAYYNAISSTPVFCVYSLDNDKAFVGTNTTNGGSAKILRTTNKGVNWQSADVSSMVTFINDIKFFDNNNGILVGDPVSSKWAFGKTTDAGATWKAFGTAPAPLANESGFVGSFSWFESTGWFGSNLGNVYKTPDGGNSWTRTKINNAVNVNLVCFQDHNKGLAVYTESASQNSTLYLASTSDGGATWTPRVYNFTQNGYVPIYLFSQPEDRNIYIFCGRGQILATENLGTSWKSVLSENDGIMLKGSAVLQGSSKIRLWQVGQMIGRLDFAYSPLHVLKTLEVNPLDQLKFDTVDVGKTKTITINLNNKGNTDILFTGFAIAPRTGVDSSEFITFGPLPSSITPGVFKTVRVKFQPKKDGLRQAILKINSDADENVISIPMLGYGKEVVSVLDSDTDQNDGLVISPNPSSASSNVSFSIEKECDAEVRIIDLSGKMIKSIFSGKANSGMNVVFFDTIDIANGTYIVEVIYADQRISKKLVINK